MNSANDIESWQPNFNEHFRLSILAPSDSGKSYLIRHLFIKHKFSEKFDLFVVFSNSLDNAIESDFFGNFIPGNLQFDRYRPEVVSKLFRIQDEHMKKHGKYLNILFIFDDCVSVKNKYSDEIMQIFVRGRNKNMSIIFTTQSPNLMNKDWRTQSSYVIMLYEKDAINRRKNIDNFLRGLVDSNASDSNSKIIRNIDNIYLAVTKVRYQALVADYKERKLFKYKAD